MDFLLYLLKFSALLLLILGVYEFFLKKETFFTFNRIYLLLGIAVSAVLPAIHIKKIVFKEIPVTLNDSFKVQNMHSLTTSEANNFFQDLTLQDFLIGIYLLGICFFIIRFIIKLTYLIIQLKKNFKKEKLQNIYFLKTNRNIVPFSFFNRIVFNPNLHSEKELKYIIAHEKAHVNGRHNFDVLISQFVTIFLWFNPFSYLYQKRVKENLEYIADHQVKNLCNSPKEYQYSLVNNSIEKHQEFPIINFNHSFLKNRIIMLNKNKSSKQRQLKTLFILPILALFFMSFQTKEVVKYKANHDQENSMFSNGYGFIYSVSKNTTKDKLEEIQKELKEKFSIDLFYHDLQFNTKDEIISIHLNWKDSQGDQGEYFTKKKRPIERIYFSKYEDSIGFFRPDVFSGLKNIERAHFSQYDDTLNFSGPVALSSLESVEELTSNLNDRSNINNQINVKLTPDFIDTPYFMSFRIDKTKSEEALKEYAEAIEDLTGAEFRFQKVKRNSDGEITKIKIKTKDKDDKKSTFVRQKPKGISPITIQFFPQENGEISIED